MRSLLLLSGCRLRECAPAVKVRQAAFTMTVSAPIAGMVTERVANPGFNVDPSTKMFTVVDLSTCGS